MAKYLKFSIFKNSISLLFNNIFTLLSTHIQVIFYDLDPVKDAKMYHINPNQVLSPNFEAKKFQNSRHFNLHYFIPFLCIVSVCLEMLSTFYQHHFHYSSQGMPELFLHLIMPKEFWPQIDIMFSLGLAMALIIYPCLITDSMLNPKCWMFLFVDQKSKTAKIVMNGKGIV